MKPISPLIKDAKRIEGIFNALSKHYDLINRLLSAGIDQHWRKKLSLKLTPTSQNLKILDIATGTGDQIVSLCQTHSTIKTAIGIDLAENMLAVAEKKVIKKNLLERIQLQKGNTCNLAFEDETFDAVTCSFGLRNFDDLTLALNEIFRVLKPNGQLLILEFSLPKNKIFKNMYIGYFRHILPALGNLFSNHPNAYTYLNQSVEQFPYGDAFADILRRSKFSNIEHVPLSFGISTIYSATK